MQHRRGHEGGQGAVHAAFPSVKPYLEIGPCPARQGLSTRLEGGLAVGRNPDHAFFTLREQGHHLDPVPAAEIRARDQKGPGQDRRFQRPEPAARHRPVAFRRGHEKNQRRPVGRLMKLADRDGAGRFEILGQEKIEANGDRLAHRQAGASQFGAQMIAPGKIAAAQAEIAVPQGETQGGAAVMNPVGQVGGGVGQPAGDLQRQRGRLLPTGRGYAHAGGKKQNRQAGGRAGNPSEPFLAAMGGAVGHRMGSRMGAKDPCALRRALFGDLCYVTPSQRQKTLFQVSKPQNQEMQMSFRKRFTPRGSMAAVSALAALGIGFSMGASAQTDDPFYTNRQVTMIASGSVGGGYDQYARHLARHMTRHIPGNPNIIVQNMTGASGVTAANHLAVVAAQDGSVIGQLQRNVPFMPLLEDRQGGESRYRFDGRAFHWLGSPQQELGLLLVSTATGVRSLEDLKTREITTSSTARGAATSIYPRLMNQVFGTQFRVIEGYSGSQTSLQALENGEVDAHVSGGSSANFRNRFRPWVEEGKVIVLIQMGLEKDPEFPDAPLLMDLPMSDEDRRMFELAFAEQIMGRPFLAPPGVPAGRVQLLRAAFDATMKDPAYLAEAETQRLEINPVSGERINRLLDTVYGLSEDFLTRYRESIR